MDKINYSLSSVDMVKLNPGVKIVTYDELSKIDDIDELLYPSGKLIILYMHNDAGGHWTCLFVRNGELHFFCSYGYKPDTKQLDNVPIEVLKEYDETNSQLCRMMIKSRYKKLFYNSDKFQASDEDITTCGRWCTIRLYLAEQSDEMFKKQIKKFCNETKLEPDEMVTKLTSELYDIISDLS